jgi:hypothetical protein
VNALTLVQITPPIGLKYAGEGGKNVIVRARLAGSSRQFTPCAVQR